MVIAAISAHSLLFYRPYSDGSLLYPRVLFKLSSGVSSPYSVMGNLICDRSLSMCDDPSQCYPVLWVPIKLSILSLAPRWITAVLCPSLSSVTHLFWRSVGLQTDDQKQKNESNSPPLWIQHLASCFFVTNILTYQTHQHLTLKSTGIQNIS